MNQYVSLECEFKDLKEKFNEESKERKDLYNKLIDLKGLLFYFIFILHIFIADTMVTKLTTIFMLLR